ncbi:hypothetical protein JZ751_018930 [Albula glossodonta]|uniref:Uncharacterized protein n=1 Tax=Albula glossodonta TaxID=121402 RepID=A0A8T2N4Q1_9TELE|nr:hypothetical protein JZ751_018930 [Albula glossodonta]
MRNSQCGREQRGKEVNPQGMKGMVSNSVLTCRLNLSTYSIWLNVKYQSPLGKKRGAGVNGVNVSSACSETPPHSRVQTL